MNGRRLALGAGEFAQGLVRYADNVPGGSRQRSYSALPVRLDGWLLTWAIVDTGAEYCVIGPEEAADLDIASWGTGTRNLGGGHYDVRFGRLSIGLIPDEGEGQRVTLEAHVWAPVLRPGQGWPHPNILGLSGFLSRIRFAVDLESNLFYFGALGEAGE